jgi:hypothetical protein
MNLHICNAELDFERVSKAVSVTVLRPLLKCLVLQTRWPDRASHCRVCGREDRQGLG